MLVLTRKLGESVIVGNSIRIRVIELSGNTVRLGFDAPSHVSIYREEIHREIADANRAAFDAPEGVEASDAAEAPDAATEGRDE